MAKISGGGILGNKNVSVGVRTGQPRKDNVSVGGVSQIGSAMGSTVKAKGMGNGYGGTNSATFVMAGTYRQPPLGNQVALNVGKGGPGAGRVVYGQSGSQSQTPTARPMPQGRNTLLEFGPDVRGKGAKR